MMASVLLACVGPLAAAETVALSPSPSPQPSVSPTPLPLKLGGRWGIGFDTIPGASTNASLGASVVPGLSSPNALAVRYWVTEGFCWDGLVTVNLSSQPPGGNGAAGVPAGTDERAFGVGTRMKLNLKRPTRWLLAQAVGRASLASLQQLDNTGSGGGNTTTTFGLGVGLGFEAFLPFWDALSVEGAILADFNSSQTKVSGSSQAAQSGSSLSIDADGFTPLNVGIHLYF
jgi:hypothetical protein